MSVANNHFRRLPLVLGSVRLTLSWAASREGVPGRVAAFFAREYSVTERYELIEAEQGTMADTGDRKYTITRICEWLDVSTSGYYEWWDRGESATAQRRAYLKLMLAKAFELS